MFSDEDPLLIKLVDELLESIAFQEEIFFEKKDQMGHSNYNRKLFDLKFEKLRAEKLRSNIENAWIESPSKYEEIRNEAINQIQKT